MTNVESEKRKKEEDGSGGGIGGAWETLGPTLAALVTGVGLLAFVALFGGAILWDRAEQAGLPGTEAAALVPRSTLLSTGGHFLVWALVLSVVAVATLWLIDTVLVLLDIRAAELEAKDAQKHAEAKADRLQTKGLGELKALDMARVALAKKMRLANDAQAAVKHAQRASGEADAGNDTEAKAQRSAELTEAYKTLQRREKEVRQAQETLRQEAMKRWERRSRWVRFGVLAVLLLFLELGYVYFREWLDLEQIAILVGVSVGTSILAVAVYQETRKFSWFAVVAFLGISAFQGVATHYEINSVPRVEPAAVLIGGLPPITGVFVAQTDDRIYVGVSKNGLVGESAALVALSRDRVSGLAVGQLTKTSPDDATEIDATERAAELAEILCSQVPEPTTEKQRLAQPMCP